MWSMPRNVLQIVAVIIGICAVSGFALGLRNVPDRARMPGESTEGGASALEATDATPIGELLVTDPPPAPEEKADEEEEKTEEQRAAEMARLEQEARRVAAEKAAAAQKAAPPVVTPPEDKVGDLLDGLDPPVEQPPY